MANVKLAKKPVAQEEPQETPEKKKLAPEKPQESPEKKKLALPASLSIGKKGAVLPSKKTMNFLPRHKTLSASALVIVMVVVVVALLLLIKVGFVDPISKRNAAELECATIQSELAALEEEINKYGDLALDYDRYSYYWMTETELATVSRVDILKLVERQVMSVATVENFSVDDNVMTMNIRGVTLERASAIVKDLESNPMVESAAVYSASAADAMEASIFMSITLVKEGAADE